jgi:MarR family transcriptional regulator, temperature-dependent positive regulator of motility
MPDVVSAHGADAAVLHLMRRVLQRHGAQWAKDIPEMTKAQWAVLRAVQADPGREQKAVGEHAAIDKATLVPLVARLAERGWLTPEVDPADRRRRLLRLTPSGRSALKRAHPRVAAIDAAALEPLDENERSLLRELLTRLARGSPGAS